MAEFFVTHSLNYSKSVKFNITLRYIVPLNNEGEHAWILEIGTTYPDSNGDPIPSKKIHDISAANLDEVIESGVADLCSLIDWSPFYTDREAPYVSEVIPSNGDTDTSIHVNVYFTIADYLPSAGIDLSNIKVTLNNSTMDFDITSEIESTGDPYEYVIKWSPPMRVHSTYD